MIERFSVHGSVEADPASPDREFWVWSVFDEVDEFVASFDNAESAHRHAARLNRNTPKVAS
jgi:hypothetical protein